MWTSVAPAAKAAAVLSICSAGAIGTAGFCALVGWLPVIATVMTAGEGMTGLDAAGGAGLGRSELLRPRPEVELLRPGAARLQVELPIALGHLVGVEQGVGAALGAQAGVALGVDLAVDDHMGDVDALGPELPRHALSQRAQPELADGKVDEAGAAAQRRGGAGEQNRTGA